MFSVTHQVLIQTGFVAVVAFFLAQVGGQDAVTAFFWALVVAIAAFFLRRQNLKVASGTDILHEILPEELLPEHARGTESLKRVSQTEAAIGSQPSPPQPSHAMPNGTDRTDDLKRISGIGPKLESELNRLGYYRYDQIAAWSEEDVARIDDTLVAFKGRASRDNWVEQARALLNGS